MGQIPDFYHDVGPGWHSLLANLHTELLTIDPGYELLQQKEKWGILRVYISVQGESHPTFDVTLIPGGQIVTGTMEEGGDAYSRAMDLVHNAERKSRVICEDCGEPGVLRTDRFWLRTLCDECNLRQPPRVSEVR